LEEFNEDGGYWKGLNYTFDKRFAHGAEKSDIMGECCFCKKPWNKYRGKKRCPPCGVPLLLCDTCQANQVEAVCNLCQKQGVKPKSKIIHTSKKKAIPECGVCKQTFPSRNAMFKHIKETGHANRHCKK
jgi:predicted sulfurtransferase